jgi:hypothetical protein
MATFLALEDRFRIAKVASLSKRSVYTFGMETTPKLKPLCSFCKKSQDDVALLIASPTETSPRVYICDECVGVCASIIEEWRMAKIPVVFPSTPEEKKKAQELYDAGFAASGADTDVDEEECPEGVTVLGVGAEGGTVRAITALLRWTARLATSTSLPCMFSAA